MRDFFIDFRGQECIVSYSGDDIGDWYIAPMDDYGKELAAFDDLSDHEADIVFKLVTDNYHAWNCEAAANG